MSPNVRIMRSFAERSGAKFGKMASRAIFLIILVKRPDDQCEESAAWLEWQIIYLVFHK